MSSPFLKVLDLKHLSPVRIWAALDLTARAAAARAYYAQSAKDDPLHLVIDSAIARALRFRAESVKKMPVDKKAGYLARMVQPDENLSAGLLQALHLEARRPLLCSFLDALAMPHDNGHIDGEAKLTAPAAAALEQAATAAYATHPPEQVDVYFATLLLFDPATWSGLGPLLERRQLA